MDSGPWISATGIWAISGLREEHRREGAEVRLLATIGQVGGHANPCSPANRRPQFKTHRRRMRAWTEQRSKNCPRPGVWWRRVAAALALEGDWWLLRGGSIDGRPSLRAQRRWSAVEQLQNRILT